VTVSHDVRLTCEKLLRIRWHSYIHRAHPQAL